MPQETIRYERELLLSGEYDIFSSVLKAAGDTSEGDVIAELGGLLKNPKATAYVQAVGKKLVSGSNRTDVGYAFDVIKNDEINAFALPNGAVYVTKGLLRVLRNEAQLANVIGHEVGHVDRDHSMKQFGVDLLGQGAGILAQVFAGGDKAQKDAAKEVANNIISNGYSQELEMQADEIGQKFAYMAGWDPNGMIDIMTLFLTFEKSPNPPQGVEAYTRSHPHAEVRLEQAKTRMAAYPAKKETGEAQYKAFLKDTFGLSDSEMALTPKQAITTITPKVIAAAGTSAKAASGGVSEYLIPALAIGGVAIAVLVAVYLYTRE